MPIKGEEEEEGDGRSCQRKKWGKERLSPAAPGDTYLPIYGTPRVLLLAERFRGTKRKASYCQAVLHLRLILFS